MSNKNSSSDVLVSAASLAAISIFFFLHPAGSSDIFWQMKAGEVMWGSKEFLSSDLFSFTMQGRPWINFEWLSEIIFYVVWRFGGFAALSVLSFATGLGLAAALFSSFLKISGSRYLALLLVFSVFFIGAPRFGVLRPELFGFLFFAAIFHLLATRKETANRRIWLCLPLIVIWANIHPSVILGVLLVVIYAATKLFENIACHSERSHVPYGTWRSEESRENIVCTGFGAQRGMTNVIFIACCILAPLANPLGYKIYSLPFHVLTQSYAMDVTSDWTAPAWFSGEISFAAWGLAALAMACIAAMIARRRFHIPLAAAAVVFTVPALLVSRFIPFAAIAWAFLAARAFSGIEGAGKSGLPTDFGTYLTNRAWDSSASAEESHEDSACAGFFPPRSRLGEAGANAQNDTKSRAFRVAAVLLCLGMPIFMFHAGPIYGVQTPGGKINFVFGSTVEVGLDETDFPVAAADFIENASFNGEIFNDMAWGGYLIWRLWPRHKVFIDTRTHLYGDAFIKEYADALFNEDAFKKVAKKYNIGCIIYDKRQIEAEGGPLKFLSDSPQWKREYDMGNAAVFLRREMLEE